MAKARGGLGKGLGALFEEATMESGNKTKDESQQEIAIEKIEPNPNQPRTAFDQEQLNELANSILKEGLLQPILVRPVDDGYQIIAGERRYQACKLAGLEKVNVRILEMDEEQTLRVAMIENLQRTDLNAIEEARGFKNLMSVGNLTQAEVASAVSKSRSTVANALRLLDLPAEIQEYIYDGRISAGHARAILSIPEFGKRMQLAEKIATEKMSVRQAEKIARLYAAGELEKAVKPIPPRSYKMVAKELKSKLNTTVKVKNSGGKNRIEIEFKDEEDLQRIYGILNK